MANYTSGAARKLSRSMGAEAREVTLQCVTKDRDGWTAEVRREGNRAIGRLYQRHGGKRECIRSGFNVAVDTFDAFSVDIGTGSGVKVKFHFGTPYVPTMTREEIQKKLRTFLDGEGGTRLDYLQSRWRDEREYEDWSEYVAEMKKLVPEGFEFERATKSPFGFTMTAKGMPGAMQVTATATTIKIKHIRI
jgi:hypothetical protein